MGFFSKLLRLLINITEITTEHQKWLKISTNSVKSSFFVRRAKKASSEGRSPPQELEVSPHSGLYLLVTVKDKFMEEKVKMYVKIKGFPWWPAFFKQEGNNATFLDNQIGHPLEVRDFTDANKELIMSSVRFSKKTGSSKNAFLCDNAKISNM